VVIGSASAVWPQWAESAGDDLDGSESCFKVSGDQIVARVRHTGRVAGLCNADPASTFAGVAAGLDVTGAAFLRQLSSSIALEVRENNGGRTGGAGGPFGFADELVPLGSAFAAVGGGGVDGNGSACTVSAGSGSAGGTTPPGNSTRYTGTPFRICNGSNKCSSTTNILLDIPLTGGSKLSTSNRTCAGVFHMCIRLLLGGSRSATAPNGRSLTTGVPRPVVAGSNTNAIRVRSAVCPSGIVVASASFCSARTVSLRVSRSRQTDVVGAAPTLYRGGAALDSENGGGADDVGVGGDGSLSLSLVSCMPSNAPLIRDIVSVSALSGASRNARMSPLI